MSVQDQTADLGRLESGNELTISQRAMIAARMLPRFEAEAKKRKTGRPAKGIDRAKQAPSRRAADDAAKLGRVGARSIERAKALLISDPQAAVKVQEGATTLRKAEKQLRRRALGLPLLATAEVVYFIQARDGGPIKIGRTDDVDRRLAEIQLMCPVPIRILATIQGDHEKETELHHHFARLRLHGEWFSEDDELISFIRSVPVHA